VVAHALIQNLVLIAWFVEDEKGLTHSFPFSFLLFICSAQVAYAAMIHMWLQLSSDFSHQHICDMLVGFFLKYIYIYMLAEMVAKKQK
jgi:hypothetical protein